MHYEVKNFKSPIVSAFCCSLNDCLPGRADAAAYEKVCTDILAYLFEDEFAEFVPQCPTDDSLHRMDLQCALRGSTPFWRYLKHKFNSDFLVVEMKNYSTPLHQTPLLTTQKYLCRHVFRNVAFLISRKGLSPSAQCLAKDALRNSQLIVELTDDDLIAMLRMKAAGQEPSDYLMHKVHRLLMGISA